MLQFWVLITFERVSFVAKVFGERLVQITTTGSRKKLVGYATLSYQGSMHFPSYSIGGKLV